MLEQPAAEMGGFQAMVRCRLLREALRLPVSELLRRGCRKLQDEATKPIGRLLLLTLPLLGIDEHLFRY